MENNILAKAKQLDAADTLAPLKDQFHFPQKDGKDCLYFCGNSLGLQPKTTDEYLSQELRSWRENGVEGHFTGDRPWVSYHENSKESLAKLVGANTDEVVAMNNLTTNLHLAMISFYQPSGSRTKILIEKGAFPSDFYAVHSQIEQRGLNPDDCLVELESKDGSDYLSTEEITAEINRLGDSLALVMFPGVQYYTGQFFDIKSIASAAHEVGALAGFDLAHAVGNVPLHLHNDKIDFAVWCTYKYLNSGPGGVGGMFVHENHARNKELTRLSGWWGHDAKARFKMANEINPIPTIDGWQLSNVNILSHAAHLASLSLFNQVGIKALRKKSLSLTRFLEECIESSSILKEHIKILTPTNPEERGCQLSLYLTKHGKSVFDYLIDRGVILDWREPNVLRAAPVPFYNSFTEVAEFTSLLEDAINNEQ